MVLKCGDSKIDITSSGGSENRVKILQFESYTAVTHIFKNMHWLWLCYKQVVQSDATYQGWLYIIHHHKK